jgi:activating signal cointegrator complex subunit 1
MPPPRPKLTHFLCLPLVNSSSRPQWQVSLNHFAENVNKTTATTTTNDDDISKKIPPEAIRPLGTLHITIGVLSLPTPELQQAALTLLGSEEVRRILREATMTSTLQTSDVDVGISSSSTKNNENNNETQQLQPPESDLSIFPTKNDDLPPHHHHHHHHHRPLITTFSNLHAMRSPSSTSVLYVSPHDPESRIHNLCISLQRTFQAANLLVPDNRPLTLHATVLNTVYASSRARGGGGGGGSNKEQQKKTKKKRGSTRNIDATQILERYAGFEWARDVRIEKVGLWKMGAKKVVVDGVVVDEVYEEVGSGSLIVDESGGGE